MDRVTDKVWEAVLTEGQQRAPLSLTDKPIGERFKEILLFHVPPPARILDPTCGRKRSWEEILRENFTGRRLIDLYDVVFCDKRDLGGNIVCDVRSLGLKFGREEFDAVYYDPPYLYGYEDSKDDRRDDYGDYNQSRQELLELMTLGNEIFPILLRPEGKLIVKCSDMYVVKDRCFDPLHHHWIEMLTNFILVDVLINMYHAWSPTAFQVKNRPCSVVNHTYFLIFRRL